MRSRSVMLVVTTVMTGVCTATFSCSTKFEGDVVADELQCQPLDLFAYEFENSCVTSGAAKDECNLVDAAHSHTVVDPTKRSIAATAINSTVDGYFGTAYRIFVIPNGPKRVTLQGSLTGLETRSDAKMQVRAGCFFEWSGNDMYNTLIPYVSRENRFALKYSRNGTPPGDGVESVGQEAPRAPTALQLQLSVDASLKFSAATGIIRSSGTSLLNKSWTGQPAISTGIADSFDPTKFRIFCGATVEDGDGKPMSVSVSLSDIQGTVCYGKSGAGVGADGG